jgi:hypothetical protein
MSLHQNPVCPLCGMTMSVIHDGTRGGIHFACPQCPTNGKYRSKAKYISTPKPENPVEEPRSRFRRLLQSDRESRSLDLPESLLADLPADARRLLSKLDHKARPSIGPRLCEDLTEALREQGIDIDTGSTAHRLNQPENNRAVQAKGRCPSCDAFIPEGQENCTWCGTTVD